MLVTPKIPAQNDRNTVSVKPTVVAVAMVVIAGWGAAAWAQSARGALPDPKTFKYS